MNYQAKIAALKSKTVQNGCTAAEAASAKAMVAKLQQKLNSSPSSDADWIMLLDQQALANRAR